MVDLERSTQLTSGPELRDVAANRSEYEPKAGLHYKATDTGAEFVGDGERWNKIQSTGANPSFRSVESEEEAISSETVRVYSTTGTYEDIKPSAYNGDYGALINDYATNNGIGFELPVRNNLRFNQTIDLRGGLEIRGHGENASILRQDAGQDLTYGLSFEPTDPEYFPTLQNFKLNGNKSNNTGGSGLLLGNNQNDTHLQNVFISKWNNNGVQCKDTWGVKLSDCLIEFCDTGIDNANGNMDQMMIRQTFIAHMDSYGIHIHGGGRVTGCNWQAKINDVDDGSGSSVAAKFGDSYMDNNTFTLDIQTVNGTGVVIGGSARSIHRNTFFLTCHHTDLGLDLKSNSKENVIWIMGSDNTNGLFTRSGGTRNIVNGLSPNAGDPSAGSGQWSGKSDVAFELGATVIDTSTEGTFYKPLPPSATSNWAKVAGTAV